jgi:superfamily I DNA/RNA helicase
MKLDITKFKLGDRMLCYTNDAVGKWNSLIARHLGISSIYGQECVVGNSIALVSKAKKPSITELVSLYEQGELNLQNSQISKKFIKFSLQQLLDFKHIEWAYVEGKLTPIIVGINEAYKLKKKIKADCIKNRANFKHLYTFNRAFVVDYIFCSTVHKSQGSEFESVFIDKYDIQKSVFNNSYSNYARLMYVAISRAKRKLYI